MLPFYPKFSSSEASLMGKESQTDESAYSSAARIPGQALETATNVAGKKVSAIRRIADDAYRLELTNAMARAQNEGFLPHKATRVTSLFLPKVSPDE